MKDMLEHDTADDARPEDDCCYHCDDGHGSGLCPDCEAQRITEAAELRAAVEALHVALANVFDARWAKYVPAATHAGKLRQVSVASARETAARAAMVVAFRKAGVKP